MQKTQSLQVIGHRSTLAFLGRLGKRGRLPNALLLAGPPNVGKSTVAKTIALGLLHGELKGRTGRAHLQELDAHPDVLRVGQLDDTVARDTLRALLHRVNERPVDAPYRCVFLEDIDRLSGPSAALLLKTLEDSPPFAYFFLTTVILGRVASTIRSRALVRELAPVDAAVIEDALLERGVPPADARECARLSGGRPGLALRLAADTELRETYHSWDHVLRQPPASAGELSTFAAALDDSERAGAFLAFVQGQLRLGSSLQSLARNAAHLAPLLRRTREAEAMLRQFVPPQLVVEYVIGMLPNITLAAEQRP